MIARWWLGVPMPGGNRWLLLICEAVGVSAALLVLPCALVDLAFGTDVVSVVLPGALFALACAVALTVVRIR